MNFLNILAFIKWNVDPVLFKLGGFSVRYYSVMFALAFGLGFYIMSYIFKRENVSKDNLNALLYYVLFGTIIGARLGHTLFYEFDYYSNHLLEIIFPFKISKENGFEFTGYRGLASHGGAIGILAAIALYCKKYKMSFLWTLDRLVIVVALACFFIRVGNLFNSEIIGAPTAVPWAFVFERVDVIPRHPAQLYEAVLYLLIFSFLWFFYKRKGQLSPTGLMFSYFLVFIFLARFMVEFVKEDQKAFEQTWVLNMGQVLSIPFILFGICLLLIRLKAGKKEKDNELIAN